MKILLTDASGLTSRQLTTILSRKHHTIHAVASPGITLTKLTHHITQIHPVPSFGADPNAWLDTTLSILQTASPKFDILICSQEQVSIISARAEEVRKTGVKFAVPDLASLRRVMDKISACKTLSEAGLPQPETVVLESLAPTELEACERLLPAYVKAPIGTASRGVRPVGSVDELVTEIADLVAAGSFVLDDEKEGEGRLLVQKEVQGSLIMICGVFSKGQLLVWHACVRVREGAGGGASKKVSLPLGVIGEHLQGLGFELGWHGALSLDAILEDGKPYYIDVNPRIVEPMNGVLAGADLVDALLSVSLGEEEINKVPVHGIEGVETHQCILAFMKAAKRGRGWLLVEVFKAVMRFDQYAGSVEELTPLGGDLFWSLSVLVGLVVLLFLGGGWMADKLSGDTVQSYALSPKGWSDILDSVDLTESKQDP